MTLTCGNRIQFTLFGWIVHRAYRRLQHKGSDQSSSGSGKVQTHARVPNCRSRARASTNYKESSVSDNDRQYTSSASPFFPAGSSAESFRQPVLRENRILKRDHTASVDQDSDDQAPAALVQTGSVEESEDQISGLPRGIDGDGRVIKRRNTSMPDNFVSRSAQMTSREHTASSELDPQALLQDSKARTHPLEDGTGVHIPPGSSHTLPGSARGDTVHVEAVHRFREPIGRSSQSHDTTRPSPFVLNAPPLSPNEVENASMESSVDRSGSPRLPSNPTQSSSRESSDVRPEDPAQGSSTADKGKSTAPATPRK
jgi:hypothetical protein